METFYQATACSYVVGITFITPLILQLHRNHSDLDCWESLKQVRFAEERVSNIPPPYSKSQQHPHTNTCKHTAQTSILTYIRGLRGLLVHTLSAFLSILCKTDQPVTLSKTDRQTKQQQHLFFSYIRRLQYLISPADR